MELQKERKISIGWLTIAIVYTVIWAAYIVNTLHSSAAKSAHPITTWLTITAALSIVTLVPMVIGAKIRK